MAKYNVKYRDLQNQTASLQSIAKTLASFESRLNSIVNAMDGRNSSMASLKTQIKNAAKQIPTLTNQLNSGSTAISSISAVYLTEEKLTYSNITQIKNVTMGLLIESAVVGALINTTGVDVYTGATVANTNTTKASWWDKVKGGATAVYNVGKKAVQATGKIVSKIQEEIGLGGRFEGTWAAVKTTTKVIGSSVLIATSVASLALGNPTGVLGVVYGVNSLIGASADLYHIDKGNYDKVGKINLLKTGMQKAGEMVGENLGAGIGYIIGGDEGARTGATIGKSAGSVVGTIAYTAGGIYAAASVGNTVVRSNSGNITNSLVVKGTEYTKISKLTKLPKTYNNTKEVIDFVDAVVKNEIPSYVTGKFIGEVADGLSSTKYGEHGLSNEAMKEILREPGFTTIETDKAGISDEFIKKGFEDIMEHVIKPITVK